jgi:integrase
MPKLLDQVREVIRMKHYSIRTEQAYVEWIKRYIFFHNKRHPAEMAEPEIRAFISDLANKKSVTASTQTVALSAILFLYREVLKKELPYIQGIERAKKSQRRPVVFTQTEVKELLSRLDGVNYLIASLLYGAGLRLMDALRLRLLSHSATFIRDPFARERLRHQNRPGLYAVARFVRFLTLWV